MGRPLRVSWVVPEPLGSQCGLLGWAWAQELDPSPATLDCVSWANCISSLSPCVVSEKAVAGWFGAVK